MSDVKIYNFKAPPELAEALRQVVYEGGWADASDFMRTKIMTDKKVAAKLKILNSENNQNGKAKKNNTVQEV